MAFKQKPGRESMPKTGRSIPPTLMCGSPMKQEMEPAKKMEKEEGNGMNGMSEYKMK